MKRALSAEERSGLRLRQTCRTRGWTLTRLAKRAGVSRGALYRFLAGRKVAPKTAIALSQAAFSMLNETQVEEAERVEWWKPARMLVG